MLSVSTKPLTERTDAVGGLVDLAAYENAGGYEAARQAILKVLDEPDLLEKEAQ